ncbi:MAG: glycoside hydrolase family 97 catalytic domain-containing protein, partial [Draconibacterium sp.]|nr:glycoside hydrolase family 97 catalytic domain-containing protein [Draconibacterium sp.]
TINQRISITTNFQSEALFTVENISLDIEGQSFTDAIKKVKSKKKKDVNQIIHPEIKEKYKEIKDNYNELIIDFRSNYSFTIRAYNNGIAYRFNTTFKDEVTVKRENFNLFLADSDSIILQKSKTFNSSYETPYEQSFVKEVTSEGYCCLPALVKKKNGTRLIITESDLVDYPGLWLKATESSEMRSAHPGYPKSYRDEKSPYRKGQIKEHEDFIAKVEGIRTYPWRIFAIAENDAELLKNTLVYQLATPCKIEDVSWIEPGVVTFDWWGRRNIYDVDFKSGMNTATAKYFIDFCADFGFEYFLFDDTWSDQGDLLKIHPDLNMEEVMEHAKKKDVKVMLWAIWNTFMQQEKEAWELFEKWGISGIKFDFMNRDDQKMVQFYHHVAKEAAKRKMVIDFHGAYKPAGLRRTYPNVLTREGLIEFEYNGWTNHDTPLHHNLLPYIRMVAGPMDYIPYTTHNATRKNFRPVGDMPMGMGTRAHSMALFVILESPMQMLPDSPSDYYREKECTEFISKVPTEWDDLKVLHAKIGEHTVVARKNNNDWYIGAVTNWNPKTFEINFDFLEDGEYELEYIEDGINADTRAIDYKKGSQIITKRDSLNINLSPGGGWIAIIKKRTK